MIGRLERLFIMVYVMGAAGLYSNLFALKAIGGSDATTSPAFVISWVLTDLASLVVILSAVRNKVRPVDLIVGFFCLLMLSGSIWSLMPSQTIRLSTSVVLNIAFAWALAKRYGLEVILSIMVDALMVMIMVGLLLAALGWENAFWSDGYRRKSFLGTPPVQGLFSHKIYAGFYSAEALILNYALRKGVWRLVTCAVCIVSVLVAGSAIGLAAMLAGIGVMFFFRTFRGAGTRVLGGLLVLGAGLLLVLMWSTVADESLKLVDRDASLSGRTVIWNYAVQLWEERPLLGWAYGGIFGDASNAPGRIVRVNEYYAAPHFHNGYLQVLTELGAVGFIIFASLLIYVLFNCLRNAWVLGRAIDHAAAALMFMILAIMPAMNIGLRYNELSTVLVMYLVLAIRAEQSRMVNSS